MKINSTYTICTNCEGSIITHAIDVHSSETYACLMNKFLDLSTVLLFKCPK